MIWCDQRENPSSFRKKNRENIERFNLVPFAKATTIDSIEVTAFIEIPFYTLQFIIGESLRSYLLDRLNSESEDSKERVLDYTSSRFKREKSDFFRLCGGSLGGKARGLGFARSMLKDSGIQKKFSNVNIRVPQCAVIGTDEFDRFMKDNDLWSIAVSYTHLTLPTNREV